MNAKNRLVVSGILVVIAVGLLIPIYNSPVWWVSLEAPNYPAEAFPDGVRILFHLNGVFNGCKLMEKSEIQSEEALDCVHEMDTINHYVGMYPIASGGPVELFFSIFLLALVGVMLIGYIITKPALRAGVMAVGFVALAVWMGLTWYGADGLKYHDADYLAGRITVLGESVEEEDAEEQMTPGEALIARLKASLAEGTETESAGAEPESTVELEGKAKSIEYLRKAYGSYTARQDGEVEPWQGSGRQLMSWHYEKSLGRYFRGQETLRPMVTKMTNAGNIVFWGIIGVMVLLLVAARKPQGLFNKLLVFIPMTLPGLFVLDYAIWLGWYGHNMNSMGAFTLTPFMPTVFGQGKVAQFTTNSYPAYGFWLIVLFSVLLAVAVYLRSRQARDAVDE